MMNNLNNCIEHLNKGLELKREEKFKEALSEYNLAKRLYPTYKHTYNNIAKILSVSMENTDEILLNYLTYAHLSFLQDELRIENCSFAFENGFYNFDGYYNSQTLMSPTYTYYRAIGEENLGKIYADVNLTFNTGFTYLLSRPDICEFNQIPEELLLNQRKILLGIDCNGLGLVDSEFAPMVRNLGFLFLIDNMIDNGNNSEEFASTVYFRNDYEIDHLYNNYY